jgi:large subunit ribosomal protein L18
MSISSKDRRVRRAFKTRQHIRQLGVARLTIHRTPRHIYAQVFDAQGANVLVSASTVQETVAKDLKGTGNVDAGKAIAERAKAAGISKVAFDRSGFRYHGRVKALADAAREAGLEF